MASLHVTIIHNAFKEGVFCWYGILTDDHTYITESQQYLAWTDLSVIRRWIRNL
jgi:hypothetical protein